MSSIVVEQAIPILRAWAKERGIVIEEVRDDTVLMREGDNAILVKLVVFEDFPDVDQLNSALMELAKERNNYNKVYIAVNSSHAHLLDGKTLKKLGIGVLAIDIESGRVDEVLPSPAIKTRKVLDLENIDKLRRIVEEVVSEYMSKMSQELRIIETRVAAVENKLSQLESKMKSATGTVPAELREELSNIWNVIDRLKIEIERLKNICSTVSEAKTGEGAVRQVEGTRIEQTSTESVSEAVPEFLRDNPWVQILARKATGQ